MACSKVGRSTSRRQPDVLHICQVLEDVKTLTQEAKKWVNRMKVN